jgi:hypothetical protein
MTNVSLSGTGSFRPDYLFAPGRFAPNLLDIAIAALGLLQI